MSYTPLDWNNGIAGGTPLSEANFDHMEQGIADAHQLLEGKADAVHTHTGADITDATSANEVDTIVKRDNEGGIAVTRITGLSTATSPTHAVPKSQLDVQVLRIAALEGRSVLAGAGLTGGGPLTTSPSLAVDFGTTSGKVAQGDHTHSVDTAAVQAVVGASVVQGENATVTYDSETGQTQVSVPSGTTSVKGAVEFATNTETVAGALSGLATTPNGVKQAIDAREGSLVTYLANADVVGATNNITPTADSQLAAALDANSWYQIDVFVDFNMNATGGTAADVKMTLTVPTGTTGRWQSTRIGQDQPGAGGTDSGGYNDLATSVSAASRAGDFGAAVRIKCLTGSTAGNLVLNWAQNSSVAGAVLTRLAGSNMFVRKLS